ncbi:MAG: Proline iminopeptidase [Candidatus Accumulibacter phosphatis]|uniref:Proline iminopeptidase n=1 Tax=Candidatus Accumulibacter phosphatis TaxID=327160 RepID=A0A084Y6C0_9PROT|nr:MAG: Proline iminopeptidase [Candidatus Accumulibacter phosphatis]MBL8407009.1 alpha/beta hydrolase [Accumulibacter sp.]HRF10884.1 alpha/beta hydrolase [Candidatus Accumulibacter phosphatis]
MSRAFVDIDEQLLEYEIIPAQRCDRPTLVLLHEGLGSMTQWRDFPAALARASACRTLVWSRLGHGHSAALGAPRTAAYLHEEALQRLPSLLAALAIERPLLVGHSDGGSIALLYAAAWPQRLSGVVLMAPHEFVEEKALAGIRAAGDFYASSEWPQKLGRYHRDPDAVFRSWHDTWLAPEFRTWDIRACLSAITCPLLAIQGEDDEYATMRQIECIAEAAADVELLKLAGCRHSPHRDQPQSVIDAIVRFIDRIAAR